MMSDDDDLQRRRWSEPLSVDGEFNGSNWSRSIIHSYDVLGVSLVNGWITSFRCESPAHWVDWGDWCWFIGWKPRK